MSIRTLEARLVVVTTLFTLPACISSARPTLAERRARGAVQVAESLGADDTPAAAYALGLARSELERAERLSRQGEMDRAGEVLERAKADAELAIALRREDEAREAVVRTHAELDQLHDEALGTDGAALPTGPVTPVEAITEEETR